MRNIEARYGLDQPYVVQMFNYVKNIVLHFDFGPSFKLRDMSVTQLIASGFPVTITYGSIAFVLAVVVCFLFAASGTAVVTEFLSSRTPLLAEAARSVSVFERFNGFVRGVVALRDLVFFASLIAFFLFVNVVVLDHRKAD